MLLSCRNPVEGRTISRCARAAPKLVRPGRRRGRGSPLAHRVATGFPTRAAAAARAHAEVTRRPPASARTAVALPAGAVPAELPASLEPELATLVDRPVGG